MVGPTASGLQGMQHLALSDCVGTLPPQLLRAAASAASTAAISLAITDLSTAEGAAAVAATGCTGSTAATLLHTAGARCAVVISKIITSPNCLRVWAIG